MKSCCLWAAPAVSVRVGRHPVGGTPRGAGAESDCEGVAETKRQGLTVAPIPLHRLGKDVEEGGWGGKVFLVCF